MAPSEAPRARTWEVLSALSEKGEGLFAEARAVCLAMRKKPNGTPVAKGHEPAQHHGRGSALQLALDPLAVGALRGQHLLEDLQHRLRQRRAAAIALQLGNERPLARHGAFALRN